MNLQERLESVTAHRKIRYSNARYVLDNPNLFEQLLQFCFSSDEKLATRASWVFEFVCIDAPFILVPHFEYWVEHLPQLTFDSAKRPQCHILYLFIKEAERNNEYNQVLTTALTQQIISLCFDWLINDEKVALKCYSMRVLQLLGKNSEWVYPELQLILEQNIHLHTAAYKAAANQVLKKIRA